MTHRLHSLLLAGFLVTMPAAMAPALGQEGEQIDSFVLCDSVSDLQALVDRITNHDKFEQRMADGLNCRVVPLTGSGFRMEAAITDRGEPVIGPGLSCLEAGCAIYQDAAGYIRGRLGEAAAFAVLPVTFVKQMLEAAAEGGDAAGASDEP